MSSQTLEWEDQIKFHGKLSESNWKLPIKVKDFDANARITFTDIKAHEYFEEEEVLDAKVRVLAQLIREAKNFIVYTGAGISTAAGIDDYASKSKSKDTTAAGIRAIKDWKQARPTIAHRILTTMYKAGYLKHWIQQNHDSLPQKAGYPQYALNEIHGSLHDPANPIVPYEGSLRPDLFEWMDHWKNTADLCIAMGTSMSGFTADEVPMAVAERFSQGEGKGLVVINLQQTKMDHLSSLRIFQKIDDVLLRLAKELDLLDQVQPMTTMFQPLIPEHARIAEDVYQIPFDETGQPSNQHTVWDLRIGTHVQLTGGPYEGDIGRIIEKSPEGHYRIRFENSINKTLNIPRRPFSLWLGSWWIEMAIHGHGIVPDGKIPFITVHEAEPSSHSIQPAIDFSKYLKMIKIGLAREAVIQRMECDMIQPPEIEKFLELCQ